MISYPICLSLSGLFHLAYYPLGPYVLSRMAGFPLLWPSNIPLYVSVRHISFIHSSVDRHWGCFHVLTVVNNAAVNLGVQIPLQNANQNHSEIRLHTCQNGYYQKDNKQQMLERVWRRETLLHCGWEYKLVQPLWKTTWRWGSSEIKSRITKWSSNPTPGHALPF